MKYLHSLPQSPFDTIYLTSKVKRINGKRNLATKLTNTILMKYIEQCNIEKVMFTIVLVTLGRDYS